MEHLRPPSFSATTSSPTQLPAYVYRVHRPSSQTRYAWGEGFRSKNQTTIVNSSLILRQFSLAHLNQQTNVSSPFISVYDNEAQAVRTAQRFVQKYGEETRVVKIDTSHLPRGPVFRAADLLVGREHEMGEAERDLHRGEYLIMYRIPLQAIITETPVGRPAAPSWMAVGTVGSAVGV